MTGTLLEFAQKLGDYLSPLLEFAKKFRGFIALVAFLVLTGTFVFVYMFSQGSFDSILNNFDRLSSEHFYNFVIIALLSIVGFGAFLVALSFFKDTTYQRLRQNYTLRVIVHEEGDATTPVRNATVKLRLDEIHTAQTNELGSASFFFNKDWLGRTCPISARHADYENRPPLDITLSPEEPILIALKRKEQPAQGDMTIPVTRKVFISHGPEDKALARSLEDYLKRREFFVWLQHGVTQGGQVGAAHDRQVEQIMQRSDYVVVLVSPTSRAATEFHVAFALSRLDKPIVVAEIDTEVGGYRLKSFKLYKDKRGEGEEFYQILSGFNAFARPIARGRLPQIGTRKSKATSSPNPFITGTAVKPEHFFGRKEALDLISGRIINDLQSVSVVANRRMGKTSLLYYVARRHWQLFSANSPYTWAVVFIDMMDARAHTVAGIMRLMRRRIALHLGRDLWDEKDDGDLMVMAEQFEELSDSEVRLVLCLDEWERVMEHPELDDLIEQLRASGSLSQIGMLVATRRNLNELTESGGLSSPFYNIFETVYLGLMPENEWMTLVQSAFRRGGREATPAQITLIGELAGGHPSLTQIAGSVLWDAQNHQWDEAQIRRMYRHKARPIFSNLWNHQPDAQKRVIQEVLGLAPAAEAPQDAWDDLKRRGVLTPDGNIFCKPFADFVRAQEGASQSVGQQTE